MSTESPHVESPPIAAARTEPLPSRPDLPGAGGPDPDASAHDAALDRTDTSAPDQAVSGSTATEMAAASLRCPACGAAVAAGERFCEACGHNLREAPPTAAGTDPAALPGAPAGAVRPDARVAVTPGAPAGVPRPDAGVSAAPPEACGQCGGTDLTDGFCDKCGARRPAAADHSEIDFTVIAGVSDIGKRHQHNEDAMGILVYPSAGAGLSTAVVCDGVSSSNRPDLASTGAVAAAIHAFGAGLAETGAALAGAALAGIATTGAALASVATIGAVTTVVTPDATAAVTTSAAHDFARAAEAAMYAGGRAAQAAAALAGGNDRSPNPPSTTFVAAILTPETVTIGWVGDSRAYWLPDNPPAEDPTRAAIETTGTGNTGIGNTGIGNTGTDNTVAGNTAAGNIRTGDVGGDNTPGTGTARTESASTEPAGINPAGINPAGTEPDGIEADVPTDPDVATANDADPEPGGAEPARLTVDDTLAGQLAAAGVAMAAEAPNAGALVRWLGADAGDTEPHVTTFAPEGPGRVIVCSDGLYRYVPEATDLAAVTPSGTPYEVASTLVNFALAAGGHDNVSVIVMPFPPAPYQPSP